MARPNYSFEKRKRELEKKRKKEEKRQRRLERRQGLHDPASETGDTGGGDTPAGDDA